MSKSAAAVLWEQEMLTGLGAGRKSVQWMQCVSRKAALASAKELREAKVLETALTGELYRARKVTVVSIKAGYPVDYLRNKFVKTLAKG
jgi:hypothetical protein